MKTIKKISSIVVLLFLIGVNTTSFAQTYVAGTPILWLNKSNQTISGQSFDIKNGSTICIYLNGCHDIHITNCKFANSKTIAVELKGACYNITIDNCYFSNVSSGVYVQDCTNNIVVNKNQFLNMTGPYPQGHAVQFAKVNGSGNIIENNFCQTIFGGGSGNPNPGTGDILNLFKSNGTPTSPIKVIGNSIEGGGTAPGANGSAGIVAGDLGGSWQDIENNILVNSGAAGIMTQGGTHITIQYNKIYGTNLTWSAVGICSANYSGVPSNNNTICNNQVNWYSGQQKCQRDTCFKSANGNEKPAGWNTNVVKSITTKASMLPQALVQVQ